MDFLFSSPSPWAWEAEKAFKLSKEQNPDIVRRSSIASNIDSPTGEKGGVHVDNIDGSKV